MKSICAAVMVWWPLSLTPSLSIHVPKWMPNVGGNGKVARGFTAALKCHAEEKIFNGLSVAFPALTCQVIRNLSLTHCLPPHSPFSHCSAPSGHDTPLITCYINRRVGWRGRLLLRWEDITSSFLLPSVWQAAYFKLGYVFLLWSKGATLWPHSQPNMTPVFMGGWFPCNWMGLFQHM